MTGRNDFDISTIDADEDPDIMAEALLAYLQAVYDEKCEEMSEGIVKVLQPQIMLRILDTRWMGHLQDMDYLKAGIGLRAYGQLDPLVEYKQEAYAAFKDLTESMYEDFLRTFLRLQMAVSEPMPEHKSSLNQNVSYSNPEDNLASRQRAAAPSADGGLQGGGAGGAGGGNASQPAMSRAQKRAMAKAGGMPEEAPKEEIKSSTIVKDKSDPYANVGRNDPCPCGSGKKYKKCHGANR